MRHDGLWLGLCALIAGCSGQVGPASEALQPRPGVVPLPPLPSGPGRGSGRISPVLQPSFANLPSRARAARPISGGTLAILKGGRTAVAADPDRDRIFVVDLEGQGALTHEVTLAPGDEPGRVIEDPAGRVHVVLRGGGAVATLAADRASVAERRAICPAPRGIAAAGDRLYVACAGGELVALPSAGGAALWSTRLEPDLRDVVVDQDGSLLVTTFRSARLLVLDDAGKLRETLAPPTAFNLTRRANAGPQGPAGTRFAPAVAWRTLPLPTGGALMLHQRAFTGEIVADASVPGGGGSYGGQGCSGGGIVESVVTQVRASNPGAGGASPALGGTLLAVDVALAPDQKTVALVAPADAYVKTLGSLILVGQLGLMTTSNDQGCVQIGFELIDLKREAEAPWTPIPAGANGRNRLRGEAVAVGFDGQGDVVVQLREPAELRVPARGLRVALSSDSRADVGHAIFHGNSGGLIACASCHPEGAEDGQVWNFTNLGSRRTQSLRGGLGETLPLHWDGDMRDVAHIAREVFTGRMGGPALAAPETEALARFLDEIPLVPQTPPADVAAVERGRVIFAGRAGCALCHSGARFTNNQSADVGTGRAFQVPSLRGLAARAPFMHTGCAPTLGARFTASCGGGDRHGVTSTLSAADAADLQTYLESL